MVGEEASLALPGRSRNLGKLGERVEADLEEAIVVTKQMAGSFQRAVLLLQGPFDLSLPVGACLKMSYFFHAPCQTFLHFVESQEVDLLRTVEVSPLKKLN
jgi:hypothetical protein